MHVHLFTEHFKPKDQSLNVITLQMQLDVITVPPILRESIRFSMSALCHMNEISFQEGGRAFHFEKFRPDRSCSEKRKKYFFSFQPHSRNEHCRVRGTVIHWQANNSHSPKAIYVAQRPALLALLSEKGGWTLGGTAVTTELVTLFIKSKDRRLEDLTSYQHGETG